MIYADLGLFVQSPQQFGSDPSLDPVRANRGGVFIYILSGNLNPFVGQHQDTASAVNVFKIATQEASWAAQAGFINKLISARSVNIQALQSFEEEEEEEEEEENEKIGRSCHWHPLNISGR